MNDTTKPTGVNGRPSKVVPFRRGDSAVESLLAPMKKRRKQSAPGQAFELDYADHLMASDAFAIGGKLEDGDDDISLYRWLPEAGHWDYCSRNTVASDALTWLRQVRPEKANSAGALSCVSTAVLELLGSRETWLPKPRDRAIVPLRGGYLEILREPVPPQDSQTEGEVGSRCDESALEARVSTLEPGTLAHLFNDPALTDGSCGGEAPSPSSRPQFRARIRLLRPDKSLGVTHVVPAALRMDRVDDEGFYEPRPVDPASKFGGYLDRFLPDLEVRALLQEAVASSLMSVCLEKGFFLMGSGSNGKSTFLHILRALHPRNVALRLDKLDGPFAMAPLVNKTAYIVTETPKLIPPTVQEVLKALISRDPTQTEAKGKDAYTMIPCGTLFASINAMFSVTGHEHGFWRKVLFIPFSVRMTEASGEREPDFHKQIVDSEAEMAQVVDWALEGAMRLIARGGFSSKLPAAVEQMAEQNRMESDTAMAYLADREVTVDDTVWTDKRAIYADYRAYVLEELGKKPVNDVDFWKRTRERFPEADFSQLSDGKQKHRVVRLLVPGVAPRRHEEVPL